MNERLLNKNIFNKLEQQGYSRKELHALVHKIVLSKIEERQKANQAPVKKFTATIIRFTKKLHHSALALLHTQYAKKPKNPV